MPEKNSTSHPITKKDASPLGGGLQFGHLLHTSKMHHLPIGVDTVLSFHKPRTAAIPKQFERICSYINLLICAYMAT